MTAPDDLTRVPAATSDAAGYDRMTDAIAEARLGPIDAYPPLREDLPDDWHFDDD